MATCRKPSVLAYPVEREQRRRLKNKVEGKVETSSLHEKNAIARVLFYFPICSAYLRRSLRTQKKRPIPPEDYA